MHSWPSDLTRNLRVGGKYTDDDFCPKTVTFQDTRGQRNALKSVVLRLDLYFVMMEKCTFQSGNWKLAHKLGRYLTNGRKFYVINPMIRNLP